MRQNIYPTEGGGREAIRRVISFEFLSMVKVAEMVLSEAGIPFTVRQEAADKWVVGVPASRYQEAARVLGEHGLYQQNPYMSNPSPWKWIARKVVRGDKGRLSRKEINFYRRHKGEYDRWLKSHRIDPRVGINGSPVYAKPGRTRHYDNPYIDPGELQMGMAVEAEHTSDPNEARHIAMDHLIEDPRYYSKLKYYGMTDHDS